MASIRVRKLSNGQQAYLVRFRTADGSERTKQFARRREATAWISSMRRLGRISEAAVFLTENTYGGAYFDHASRRMVMMFTAAPPADLREIIAGSPETEVRLVKHNQAAILDAPARIIASLESDPKIQAAVLLKQVGVADDVANNGLVLHLSDDLDASSSQTIRRLVADLAYPLSVRVSDESFEAPEDAACTDAVTCDPPLRGALKVSMDNGSCTTGFIVVSSTGSRRGSTAGHCSNTDPAQGPVYFNDPFNKVFKRGGVVLGSWLWQSSAAQNVDITVFNISDQTYWNPQNWVRAGYISTELHVTSVPLQAGAVVGQSVCHGGVGLQSNTGGVMSCGVLQEKAASWARNAQQGRVASTSYGGDSGGAVFTTGGAAYGFLKGTNSTHDQMYFGWASIFENVSPYHVLVGK